jgi:hypothetical protein
MRALFILAVAVISAPVSAQSVQSIPDDFLSKMANDLATLRVDPPPNEASVAYGMGPATAVPSRVQVDKDQTTVWPTAGGRNNSVQWTKGTEANVRNAVPGWYEVEANGGGYWVPANEVAPMGPIRKVVANSAPDSSWFSQQVEKLMKSATAFKDSYSSNPYLNVRGFSINLSLPPSVNVDFEFKGGSVAPTAGVQPPK